MRSMFMKRWIALAMKPFRPVMLHLTAVWSPAGDAVAFFRVEHGVVDLYLVPLEGTAPAWTRSG